MRNLQQTSGDEIADFHERIDCGQAPWRIATFKHPEERVLRELGHRAPPCLQRRSHPHPACQRMTSPATATGEVGTVGHRDPEI